MRQLKNKILRWLYEKISQQNLINTVQPLIPDIYISGSEIYGDVKAGEGCKIYKSSIAGKVSIGKYTSIWGSNTVISSHHSYISIGNYCSIARGVSIQESNHKTSTLTTYNILRNVFKQEVTDDMVSKGPIQIGHDVWIGANVSVLSGCIIGNGVVIGANSVVTKDLPPYAIVAGAPAKILKYRFDQETIQALIDLCWWDWSINKIKDNKFIFESVLDKELLSKIK